MVYSFIFVLANFFCHMSILQILIGKVESEAERWGHSKVWTENFDYYFSARACCWFQILSLEHNLVKTCQCWTAFLEKDRPFPWSADFFDRKHNISWHFFTFQKFVLIWKLKNVSWPLPTWVKFKTNREKKKFKLSVHTFIRSHILKNDSTLIKIGDKYFSL